MKTKPLQWMSSVAVLLCIAMAGCTTLISSASVSSRDWQFVQSVGGIAIGKPVRTGGRVHLPIACDVAGLERITTRPTGVNSGLVSRPPLVRIRDGRIFLTIRTSLPDTHYTSARSPDADLGALAAGDYSVIYLSPDGEQHALGTVHVLR